VTPLHSVSVTAVVVRGDGRILVIRRRDDARLVPPGGVLELGESPQDGVAREALEETGYEVEALRLTGVYKDMRQGVVTLAFLCRVAGGSARVTDEATEVMWLTPAEVERDVAEARAVRVTDALAGNLVPVRVHDGERVLRPG
jgi:8-oxo-dGTP diphosphatase